MISWSVVLVLLLLLVSLSEMGLRPCLYSIMLVLLFDGACPMRNWLGQLSHRCILQEWVFHTRTFLSLGIMK